MTGGVGWGWEASMNKLRRWMQVNEDAPVWRCQVTAHPAPRCEAFIDHRGYLRLPHVLPGNPASVRDHITPFCLTEFHAWLTELLREPVE